MSVSMRTLILIFIINGSMKKYFISVIFLSILATGCGNAPLFDNLSENKIHVVIKGTYESNNPQNWLTTLPVTNDDNMTVLPPTGIDSATKPANYDNWPTQYMMDIAEIQIDDERFANYRGVHSFPMTNSEPFFDGTGIPYDNDDVRMGRRYNTIQMYLRKTMYDNAYSFYPVSGVLKATVTSIFHESKTNGHDFLLDQVDNFYDALRSEYSSINRIYPLSIPISGGFVFDNKNEYVLEVRVVVKNFLKRYEAIKTVDSTPYSYHYFGFSDWLYDSRGGDGRIGGNMIGVARWYIKGQTTTVTGTASGSGFIVGIPYDDDPTLYQIQDSNRARPSDEWAPRNSPLAGSDIISLLDYYVDLQKRAEDYSLLYTAVHPLGVADSAPYVSTWDTNYNNKLSTFKIPPLAVYTSGGTFNITNVPVNQRFRFYLIAAPLDMSSLPYIATGAGAGVDSGVIPESKIGTTHDIGVL
jgi:hypothetical protein